MAVVERNGKTARSLYTVKKSGKLGKTPVSLAEVEIFTGRTHQIRLHMAHVGHPVIGDTLYGGSKVRLDGINRQMLHAWKLSIPHPVSGEIMTFCAPLPRDMEETLALLSE